MPPTFKRLLLAVAAVFSLVLITFIFSPRSMPAKTFAPGSGPTISMPEAALQQANKLPRVADIARDPKDVPSALTRTAEDHVKIELVAREVVANIAEGISFPYWTFNGTVPGPFLRVREGDTVDLTLKNNSSSFNHHNIDLHAVTGPGGGATVTGVAPGESKTFSFKASHPGLYMYHCAHGNAAVHMTQGMYGLILVEPKKSLLKVDREFYLVQGELYTKGALGESGLQLFDAEKMLNGAPDYVVFNGRIQGTVGNMQVKTGERIRLYVGNAGVNLTSSLHIIGEILDTVYPEAALGESSAVLHNVQTTLIPTGGATILEFTIDVPGKYIVVDHALARMDKGAWATIEATGPPQPAIFSGVEDHSMPGH